MLFDVTSRSLKAADIPLRITEIMIIRPNVVCFALSQQILCQSLIIVKFASFLQTNMQATSGQIAKLKIQLV
jgi:hypothetical protein